MWRKSIWLKEHLIEKNRAKKWLIILILLSNHNKLYRGIKNKIEWNKIRPTNKFYVCFFFTFALVQTQREKRWALFWNTILIKIIINVQQEN